jgi:hypothetical protein
MSQQLTLKSSAKLSDIPAENLTTAICPKGNPNN